MSINTSLAVSYIAFQRLETYSDHCIVILLITDQLIVSIVIVVIETAAVTVVD